NRFVLRIRSGVMDVGGLATVLRAGGFVGGFPLKVEAPPKKTPRKTGIRSGRKAESLKRNVVFSPETKVHYFDRDDIEEVEHERMPIVEKVDDFGMVIGVTIRYFREEESSYTLVPLPLLIPCFANGLRNTCITNRTS
ncbi:hypothetical protein Tco_1095343, partial [Tanacetum coccineum]